TGFRNLKQIDSAVFYLEKAKRRIDDNTSTATKYTYQLGEALLFDAIQEHGKALVSLEKTKAYVSGLSDEITLLINIANQNKHLNNLQQSLKVYEQALELSRKNKLYDNLQYI